MPEGDALARAARRLQVLVGEQLAVEAPNPRAAVKHIAERLDGKRLESVDAVGKNLFLRFEGGVTLRSHLKMKGRWRVQPAGRHTGSGPWLVLRGSTHEAVLWHGPVLELSDRARLRLGPDILAEPPDLDAMLANLRALPQGQSLGRGPAGPARGRRHREHVDERGALRGARLAVAHARRRRPTTSCAPRSKPPRD